MRIASAFLLAAAAFAQPPRAPLTPEQQPDTQAMAASARALARNSQASADVKAQADKLINESAASLPAEARHKLANAITLLNGQPWDSKAELAWSLVLRVDSQVSDSAMPLIARLSQFYDVAWKPAHTMRLKAMLGDRQLGAFDLATSNLLAEPFGFDAKLDGVADGTYRLRAEVLDGDDVLAAVERPIQIVHGIATGHDEIERRLAKIQGHDSTKATIRYPYILATTVNVGRRRLNEADFGLPFDPHPVPYDFVAAVKHSGELLKSLEAGKDPLWKAKGDHQRHYWLEEAREMMPYRLYVPQKWDGKAKLPMVLVLHGATRDENFYFDRDGGILAKEAERHGYLVVCPLGFRPSAEWGSAQIAMGGGGGGGRGAASGARLRENEWSEKDALNVLDLVQKEYPIDTSRIYLFGHSRGGAGAWHLGQKFPERWAAMATSAAGISANAFQTVPYERMKGLPLMIVVGDKDPALNATRTSVTLAKQHGLDPIYLESPGATHETIVAIEEPQVFDFFQQHTRK